MKFLKIVTIYVKYSIIHKSDDSLNKNITL